MAKTIKTIRKQSRNWTAVLYPESAPANWRTILDDTHLAWIESPLHDKDTDTGENGLEQKKAHWHVLVMWDGPVPYTTAENLFHQILCGTVPQIAASARGLVRYFCHMDNPEKYQYNKADIIGHNGADVAELLKPSSAYISDEIHKMQKFIIDNDITEFSEFADICLEINSDWFDILINRNTSYFRTYLQSRHYQCIKAQSENKLYTRSAIEDAVRRAVEVALKKEREKNDL